MPHRFADRLLAWFDVRGRKDLPWQGETSAYRLWVAEVMLQQTQVATVIPYYKRFLARFPTLASLAEAPLDELLHLWTGLGYYARARNLRKAARLVMQAHGGALPLTVAALTALPGIGRSTAGGIVAASTGQPAAILDGNVKRALARCFAIPGWPGQADVLKRLWAKAEALTPKNRSADYNQAIMDLGASICTPRNPKCHACPLADICIAKARQATDAYPGKKPKRSLPVRRALMLAIRLDGRLLLERRPPSGLWGGLWSFPQVPAASAIAGYLSARRLEETARQPLAPFRHSLTHFHLDIKPLLIDARDRGQTADSASHSWYDPGRPPRLGLAGPVTKILAALGHLR